MTHPSDQAVTEVVESLEASSFGLLEMVRANRNRTLERREGLEKGAFHILPPMVVPESAVWLHTLGLTVDQVNVAWNRNRTWTMDPETVFYHMKQADRHNFLVVYPGYTVQDLVEDTHFHTLVEALCGLDPSPLQPQSLHRLLLP